MNENVIIISNYYKGVHVFITKGPFLKKAAKGKLLDCFNNRKREYKKAGLIVGTQRQKPRIESKSKLLLSPSHFNISKFVFCIILYVWCINIYIILFKFILDNDDVEESMTWLHNSCDPWDMVERYWSITSLKRLEKILNTNSQEISVSKYMNDFPALKQPTGYRLVSWR